MSSMLPISFLTPALPLSHVLILINLVAPFREFSITNVTGSYRRVFQKPVDFEWYGLSPFISFHHLDSYISIFNYQLIIKNSYRLSLFQGYTKVY